MIGDPQVGHSPVARSLRHFGQGVRTVAPVGVAVKRTGQIAEFEQIRQLAGLGRLDLTVILPQFRRNLDRGPRP